ncbi:DUF551 domain-containing protein [Cronobacter malonaticus]|uniref:DUF551 domain-containing protein n=1 Tax=Cronobacter malonaticus TaxID=413503 RepID=UPI000CFC88CB|nr:DUF551 domain-containing protein [Cronobacter malonaticus]EKS1846891.1 DUF551 domain-containing protein [Cronobacter muytjensii]
MSEWIKCSERMPELDTVVIGGFLGWDGNFVYDCFARSSKASDDGWVWVYCEQFGRGDWLHDDEYEITHWMPLPAPPAE